MAEYVININNEEILIEYTYIPAQKSKYPDTEPLRSSVEIDRIFYEGGDVTKLMWETSEEWMSEIETEIINKLED